MEGDSTDCAYSISDGQKMELRMRFWGFPDGSVVKNSPAKAGDARDTDSIPGSGRPPYRKKWQPTPAFLPGKSHGQRSLVTSEGELGQLAGMN